MIRSQREKSPRPQPGAATIFGATPKGWFGGEAPPWVGELDGVERPSEPDVRKRSILAVEVSASQRNTPWKMLRA